ncbi:uncharacterized protein LOC113385880 [Ctenocephalides felis]|uniref:uncharacterized protein LOC113385880 n=1 Tax=Ctenocephalides felis TaxID=7515 RepID=UPI000E6E4A98|nr:uncharacterized protein LOC113385880 [Ctenocephalides felis]
MILLEILFICVLFAIGKCEEMKNNVDPVKPELKFVFVTVRGAAHWPCDYPGGPVIIGRPEQSSRLSWRGRIDAYNYGEEIDDLYRYRLGIQKWNKTNYWSIASTSPRTIQAALVLGAGLENKPYKINRIWSEKSKESTQFSAMKQYLRFYNKDQCPAYLENVFSERRQFKEVDEDFMKAVSIFEKELSKKKLDVYKRPQDVWLTYESMFNVFYSYKKKYPHKLKYWKKVRKEFKEFSQQLMWTSLIGSNRLRKLASGPITYDVINDMDKLTNNKPQPNAPGKDKNKLSVLTAPQGVFAALVTGFAPNGTTINGKEFSASDLYPEHGAMHVIELYKEGENSWKVKILYRNKKHDCLKIVKVPDCKHEDLCEYNTFKNSLKAIRMTDENHQKLCHKSDLE